MISLQSHNQVLFHLAQLTTAVTPRQKVLVAGVKRVQEKNKDNDIICNSSLIEAANNCTEFPLENINLQNLGTALQVNKTEVLEILKQISRGAKPKLQSLNKKWRISYVSGDSFEENKQRGFSFYPPTKFHRLSNICFLTTPNLITTRGFKTERNVKAEQERNPMLGSKIRSWIGRSTYRGGTVLKNTNETLQEDKLKNLFNVREMNEEERQRVKVAFAEGYLAGHGQGTQGQRKKWLSMPQPSTIVMLLFIGWAIFCVILAGNMFRMQIGSQVEVDPEEIDITFNHVKGADEAKQELKEVVEFLKNPEKFSVLGGKLPKGVLLVGPPGTGKTLLARAVAGEAGVPFFHAAGPEFDEILVGQGAKRVRELFKAAKERAPCVIFIDEIDSVGSKRTNSVLHPYANQTINQLLAEMDGFHQNEGVIVLGATNRQHDLDAALLRPGRFDVQVNVPRPDFTGRKEILDLYLGKVLSQEVDIELLARGTTGFTGADLENMVNQAALRAAIDGAESVTMKHLENARDKVLMGPERKNRLPDEEANLITAYHEGGHAIVAHYTKNAHPLHKVTIMPRGRSLGHTAYIPEKDTYHTTKQHLLAMMDTMMGGRAAEELIFGPEKITSGAASDLERATGIAVAMVKQWGMSEKVGLRTFKPDDDSAVRVNELSPTAQELIDSEVKRIMQESYERAKNILKIHAKEHKLLAEALIKYETLDANDVKAILSGQSNYDKTPKTTKFELPKNIT